MTIKMLLIIAALFQNKDRILPGMILGIVIASIVISAFAILVLRPSTSNYIWHIYFPWAKTKLQNN